MTKSLYGIFGGTFDPIHNGHLQTVASVQKQCGLKKVPFIPSASPPHRKSPGATAEQRLRMVELAIAGFPDFDLDDQELHRQPPSYTYDTIESLQTDHPNENYCFIIGVDALLELENWHNWAELLNRINFIVMARPGWYKPNPLPLWWQQGLVDSIDAFQNEPRGKIFEIEIEPNPLSATEIRYGIQNDIDVSAMIADRVWQYIDENSLYENDS